MFPIHSRHTQLGFCVPLAAALLASSSCGSEPPSTGQSLGVAAQVVPSRPPTKEACEACQGLWAVHGIEPVETCICRTADVGQTCDDGSACEGQCLVDETAGFRVTQGDDPPLGFYTGHCSAYDTTFGCHRMIPRNMDASLPRTADEAALYICID